MIEEWIGRIINDDCMNILRKLPDKSIDLIITDPPYELDQLGGVGKSGLGQRAKTMRDSIKFVSDGFDYEKVFQEFKRICKPLNLYIFCSNKQITKIMSYFEKDYPTTLLVWHKTNAIPLANHTYQSNAEFIVCVRDEKSTFNNIGVEKQSKIISMPYPVGYRIHPTQKPVPLVQRLLEIKSNEGDIVLDPFSGSGTTAIACHRMKRKFICIEKDEKFWNDSCKRLEDEKRQGVLF